jgi:hypothetical protein
MYNVIKRIIVIVSLVAATSVLVVSNPDTSVANTNCNSLYVRAMRIDVYNEVLKTKI